MSARTSIERRAERLVRVYPPAWRARFGEEFLELLVDDMRDRPSAIGRDIDVVAHGLLTRLAFRGLVGDAVGAERRRLVALGALAGLAVLFVGLGTGVWSQLTVGWAWSAPADEATHTAMWLMSGALFGLVLVLASGILLLAGAVLIGALRDDGLRPWRPVLTMVLAAAGLYLGCHHFGSGWPGTGGHVWPGRGLIPDWVARLGWAGTLWISSYWAHPAALSAFPADEIAWMALSPLAWLALFVAAYRVLRSLEVGPRLTRSAIGAAAIAVGLMAVFLAGAGSWVLAGQEGPNDLFAVGMVDLIAVLLLAGALIVATQLLWRAAARPVRSAVG